MYEELLIVPELNRLQRTLSREERDFAAGHLAGQINERLAADGIPATEGDAAADHAAISDYGYVVLGQLLSPQETVAVREYFTAEPCFNFHVACRSDGIGRKVGQGAEDYAFGSYRLESVVRAPHLLELANHPRILALATAYLGCTPTLYSLNAWWSFHAPRNPARLTQSFHRDSDDFKFCSVFVYLTDTYEGLGEQEYIRHSHRPDLIRAQLADTTFPLVEIEEEGRKDVVRVEFNDLFAGEGYKGDPVYRALFGDQIDRIQGPAGTAFAIDPSGLHRGCPPAGGDRLMFWARYGLYPNVAYRADQLAPAVVPHLWERIEDSPRARYINRLIVRPG